MNTILGKLVAHECSAVVSKSMLVRQTTKRGWVPAFWAGFATLFWASSALAQNVPADSVTANGTPDRWGHSSCQATLAELSDGSNANPGVCYLAPLDPNFEITFSFSPANNVFMDGIDIWANAGNSMTDNELRRLDVEVDYFDPTTNATQTLSLDNVNIGNTTSFNDPKFVSFGGSGLYQVSEVRISDMVGTSANGRVVFREVQGVFSTQAVAPEITVASSESGSLSDGGTDAQGTEPVGTPKTVTYTITNTGTDTLTLVGTPTVSGESNISGAVSVGAPGALSLAPGATTTFDVTYTPDAAGAYGFDIDVPSNDADEAVFDITVSGTANEAPGVVLTSSGGAPGDPFVVTATFSEDVSGMDLSDFNVTNGVATGFSNPSPGVFIVNVTPTDPTLPVGVQVPANAATDGDGEPNTASNSLNLFVIGAPTDPELAEIESIIIDETIRDLRNGIALNQRAVREARGRHAGFLECRDQAEDLERSPLDDDWNTACPDLRNVTVEPSFEGKFTASEKNVEGNGSFFAMKTTDDGTKRRLAFGELSFNRYEGGDTSASLNGRIAWESLVGEDAMRGLFVGASAVMSDIDDTFSGNRTGYGLNAGAYFVDRLDENLYWDGFISVGLGRNNLELDNGTLDVEGDYNTTTVQAGVALTGEKNYDNFDVFPELSLAYGVTSVGDAELVSTSITGTATDTLEVSDVALGVTRFRPEFVWGDEDDPANRQQTFSAAPSVMCEMIRTDTTDTDCGAGLELEWSLSNRTELTEFSARISREVVGGAFRDQLSLSYEMQF